MCYNMYDYVRLCEDVLHYVYTLVYISNGAFAFPKKFIKNWRRSEAVLKVGVKLAVYNRLVVIEDSIENDILVSPHIDIWISALIIALVK